MKSITCKSCGGTMSLDASGLTAVCPFCGNQYVLNHEDTDYYRAFFARMNAFLAAPKDTQQRKQQAERLWESAQVRTFYREDGVPIEIKYMHRYSDADAEVYVARRNIAFHFRQDGPKKAELFRRNTALLDYPSADVRNLESFFPKISGGFDLEDGSFLLVIAKDEDEYPLRLFGALPGRHVAWIISRMENLCCVLEFSALVHPQIDPDTLYINPYTHQACLYGNWWKAGKSNTYDSNRELLQLRQNQIGLRNTASATLGYPDRAKLNPTPDIPKALVDFIRSAPSPTAYDDFGLWDEMLIKAYGERKFMHMDTDDSQIYGKKG